LGAQVEKSTKMKIALLCILAAIFLLYALAALNGYPLIRQYEYTGISLEAENNPFIGENRNKSMGVYFSFEESKTVKWIIPGFYDHERYGSPYKLDLHINSENIQEVTNVKFELSSEDGQQVTYIPENGKITLETGPHLTVYSRHIDPLESSPALNWDKIKNITLKLEFTAPIDGAKTPIAITHKYTKQSSPVHRGNPLYTDIFLKR